MFHYQFNPYRVGLGPKRVLGLLYLTWKYFIIFDVIFDAKVQSNSGNRLNTEISQFLESRTFPLSTRAFWIICEFFLHLGKGLCKVEFFLIRDYFEMGGWVQVSHGKNKWKIVPK